MVAQREMKAKPTFLDLIDVIAWLTLGSLATKIAKTFELENSIRRAGMLIHPYIYAARALFFTVMTLVGSLFIIALSILVVPSLILKTMVIVTAALLPLIVFGVFFSYPSMKIGSRVKNVEHELPFFAAYLTTMAYSGVPPERVIETVSRLKLFKGMREEAQRILRDMRLFGRDPLAAIEAIAVIHPSALFREFMLGYTTTIRTGGDVIHYLELRTQDLFRRRAEDLRMLSEKIGMIVEVFIAVNVVMALSFYVFFIVSSILPTGGFGGISTFIAFTLFVQPMISMLLLFMVDSMLPKDPVWDKSVFAYLFISMPIAVVVGLATFIALGGYEMLMGITLSTRHVFAFFLSISVALIVASLGGVKGYLEKRKLEKNIDMHLANFLRDLTETRKTGLSVERCIIYLSQREYGVLSNVIKKIAGALTIGMDLARAVRRAMYGIYNWIVLIVFKFLIDAVEYGGATPQILDALSRFVNEMSTVREELRRRLRSYIAVPYFGAVLIAFTSLLVLGMLAQSIQMIVTKGAFGTLASAPVTGMGLRLRINPRDIAIVSIAAGIGAIVNAWLMGLMSGKLRDLTILSGFVHSILLVVISLTASIIGFQIFVAPLLATP